MAEAGIPAATVMVVVEAIPVAAAMPAAAGAVIPVDTATLAEAAVIRVGTVFPAGAVAMAAIANDRGDVFVPIPDCKGSSQTGLQRSTEANEGFIISRAGTA